MRCDKAAGRWFILKEGSRLTTVNELVEKKIAGDWYDIKEASDSLLKLETVFALADEDLDAILGEIRLAVDDGIVEYKRKVAIRAFDFAESQKFDSRGFEEIGTHIAALRRAVYAILVQRLIAIGTVPARKPRADVRIDGSMIGKDVKEIVADVQARIGKNPELRKSAAVKNILMQVSIYGKELANLKELAPNIPKEKLASFQENFKKSFESITRKVQDNYAELLNEADLGAKRESATTIFARFDLKALGPLYLSQAKELAEVHSVYAYAEKERYKTREILAGISSEREPTLGLLARELREYERLSVGHAKEVAREFGWEVSYHLGKQRTQLPDDEPLV